MCLIYFIAVLVLILQDEAVVPPNAPDLAVHVMNFAMASDVYSMRPEMRVYNEHILHIMLDNAWWSELLSGDPLHPTI